MTILVTGAAGYIGSHMVLALKEAGENLVVLDNLSTGHRWAVADDVRFIVGDTGDQPLINRLIRDHEVESIIHFAAAIVVPESVQDPLTYYRNNTANSRTLMECAVKNGVKHFIFSSTAAVYGNATDNPVRENSATAPISPYGWSKLMTEIMLRDASVAHQLGYVILRYFNVAGADPHGRSGQSTPGATHLIKVAAETALGLRPKLQIFGTDYPTRDGTCIRDYIHVTDLARAHLAALHYLRSEPSPLTLNCGYGHGFSVHEVVDAVKRISGVDFPVENAPRRAGDPAQLVAATEQIRSQLAWKPQYDDLSLIVTHALTWEQRLALRQKQAAAGLKN